MKEWLETNGKKVVERKLNKGKEIDARAAVGVRRWVSCAWNYEDGVSFLKRKFMVSFCRVLVIKAYYSK